MNTICLLLFVSEASRHFGKLAYEWLLDTAQGLGIAGRKLICAKLPAEIGNTA